MGWEVVGPSDQCAPALGSCGHIDVDHNLIDGPRAPGSTFIYPPALETEPNVLGVSPQFVKTPGNPILCSGACPPPVVAADFQTKAESPASPARGAGEHQMYLGPGYTNPPDIGAHHAGVVHQSGDWVASVGNVEGEAPLMEGFGELVSFGWASGFVGAL